MTVGHALSTVGGEDPGLRSTQFDVCNMLAQVVRNLNIRALLIRRSCHSPPFILPLTHHKSRTYPPKSFLAEQGTLVGSSR